MRITIGAVGRLKRPESELFQRYWDRIAQVGKTLNIASSAPIEISESKSRSPGERRRAEAKTLSDKLPYGANIVLLDEKGRQNSTRDFAKFIENQQLSACPNLIFLIGGPDGHDLDLKQNANCQLSLSPLTLPHGLARIVLAEQIYRAMTILSGHPYHRE